MKTVIKLSILSCLFIATSCKNIITDPTSPVPSGGTKTELLSGSTAGAAAGSSSRSWVVKAARINGKDVFTHNKACSKDDILVFNGSNYERNEGPTKCLATAPQVFEKGTWRLLNNDNQIQLGTTYVYTLVELTSTSLKISYKDVQGDIVEQDYGITN